MSKELSFIHVKNIEKFHPGYKDRKLHWMKMYFDMVQGDPEFEMIESEIDKWRFICIVVLELQAQKPLPVDDEYFRRKGFDTKKRPISLTLKMLYNFLDTVTQLSKVCAIEESRVDKNKSKIREQGFEDFWNLYDKKVGDKKKLLKKFSALSDKDILDIMKYIPKYKIATPDKKYRKNPETFLNNRSWLDEIIDTKAIPEFGKGNLDSRV